MIETHFGTVEFLLRGEAAVESKCRQGYTPMHHACVSDSPDIVRFLAGAGARLDAQVLGDSQQPIHVAATNRSVKAVEVLHEIGVALDVRDSAGDRPLSIVCYHGQIEVV